jgi:hypothetical protein
VWLRTNELNKDYVEVEFLLCSCLVCLLGTMPRYPRSDPTPVGPTDSHAITASIRLAFTHTYTATPAARDSNLGSGNQGMSRLSTLAYPNDAPIHGLADKPLRLLPTDIACGTLAPRSRPGTATHAARDSNLGSGNHDMSRLSALACPNDAPIHGLALPTNLYACSQRILGVVPSPLAHRPDTHNTTQLRLY